VLQLPGARAGLLTVGCHFRLGIGGSAGVGAGAGKCSGTQQVCRSTLHFTSSLQSPGPAGQGGGSARNHDSHSHIFRVSGRSIFGAGPWTLLAAKLCLPPVEIARCQVRHASGCLSTVDDSLVRVYCIGSTSPASWRSPASPASPANKLWMRKARSQISHGEMDPLQWEWAERRVGERTSTQRGMYGEARARTNTRGDSTQINKSTCICAVHRLPSPVSRLPVSLRPLRHPLEVQKLPPRAFSPRN
jgi:hypothetical protein